MSQVLDVAALTLPNNTEAEQTILGACLVDSAAIATAAEHIVSRDFYRDSHRRIWDAMVAIHETGARVDIVTVKNKLEAQNALAVVGGAAYLASLLDGLPRITNVEQWAKIVRDKSTLRELILAASKVVEEAKGCDGPAVDTVGTALASMMRVADKANGTGGFVPPRESAKAAADLIAKIGTSNNGIYGLATGYSAIDDQTAGMHPGELITIGARPGMGKSAYAVCVGDALAQQGKKVAFFSLEMSDAELTMRRAQLRSGISVRDLKWESPAGQQHAMGKLYKALGEIASEPFFIDASAPMTVAQIRGRARRLKAEKGLDLIIVDYLQLITPEREAGGNREQAVSGISRALKMLAKELEVPVMALCQLSRACEQRDDKRPQLADLRESGGIEQDSDVVMFVYRDCVYNPQADRKSAEFLVRKQRNGPNFIAHLQYTPETTAFNNATGIVANE